MYTVYPWVLKGLFAHHIVLHHRVAHLESGVNQDAVNTSKHLGIHAAHRGSNDEVGLFDVACLPKKCQGLGRMQRQIGRNDCGLGHKCAQKRYRSRLPRRSEAVNVHYFLALHQGGVCFCWVHF